MVRLLFDLREKTGFVKPRLLRMIEYAISAGLCTGSKATEMPDMMPYLEWLESTWAGTMVRDSNWLFPMIETFHLFGIVIVVGTTIALDLRLMNLWLRRWRVSLLADSLLRWSWAGFALMVLTGAGLFLSDPFRYFYNPSFRVKMVLIMLAGVNAFAFQITSLRSVGKWDLKTDTPRGAKVAGFCSLVLWFGIVAAGRWIAFV
jgi:hypothetical protein